MLIFFIICFSKQQTTVDRDHQAFSYASPHQEILTQLL